MVGDVFNVGAQNEISMRNLAELVIEMTGSLVARSTYQSYSEAYEPGFEDMERRLPDISKIGEGDGLGTDLLGLRDILDGCHRTRAGEARLRDAQAAGAAMTATGPVVAEALVAESPVAEPPC